MGNNSLPTDSIDPDLETPICGHFGRCGGCALQDKSDLYVANWKRDLVGAALAERGIDAPIRGVHTSDVGSRRRAVFSGRRTKKTVQLGFFARRSDVLVDLTECPVLDPAIVAVFLDLRQLVRLAATRTSMVRVSATVSRSGIDVAVTDARERDRQIEVDAASIGGKFARLSWNGEVLLQRAPPIQTFGAAEVVPPPGGFLQATKSGEETLVACVQEATSGSAKIADLFAGSGTFTLPLAATADVHAVENEAAALEALDKGWRASTGLRQVSTETRDLFRRPLLQMELDRYDAVVLDPPRAGAAAQVAELVPSTVSKLAYVSCNPATYSRDAATLIEAGFTLDFVDVIDQFRWSNHVEIASGFTRR